MSRCSGSARCVPGSSCSPGPPRRCCGRFPASHPAAEPPDSLDVVRAYSRLLGPFDLFMQARGRPLLVADAARAKALWPVLGRPGAVLLNGEVAGLWCPRQSGGRLRVDVQLWRDVDTAVRERIGEQAERLARYRGVRLTGVDVAAP